VFRLNQLNKEELIQIFGKLVPYFIEIVIVLFAGWFFFWAFIWEAVWWHKDFLTFR
jgi:hypothetical protein